jgi:hypothetical protein
MSESITITNHTKSAIEVVAAQDANKGNNKSKHVLPPKETFTFFTSEIESLQWEKCGKQG